jgi:hypothetical protein
MFGCRSQDGAARAHLDGGDSAPEQHDEPVTMAGPKQTGVLAQRTDHVIDHLVFVYVFGSFVRHVHVFSANEMYP